MVQAVFDISGQKELQEYLKSRALRLKMTSFETPSYRAGKSKATVNGVQVPLNVLKTISTMLVDIHGQHENQALLNAEAPRLVMALAATRLLIVLRITVFYNEYVALNNKLKALKADSEQQDLLLTVMIGK